VDEMMLEQANALNRYWLRHPPVHELVAAQLGYGAPEEAAPTKPAGITAADRARLAELEKKWGLA
jgi:hypothetical protein